MHELPLSISPSQWKMGDRTRQPRRESNPRPAVVPQFETCGREIPPEFLI